MEKKLVIGLGGAFVLLLTVYAIMTSDNRIFNEENSLDHKTNNYHNNNPDDKINNNNININNINNNNNNEHSHSPVNNNNMNMNMNNNNNPPVNNNNINNNVNPFNQQQQQGGNFKPQQQQQQKPLNNNNNINNINNGQQQKPAAANQKGGFIIPQNNNNEEIDRFELYSTPQIPLLANIFLDQDHLSSLTDLSIQLAQLQSQNRKSFFQEMLKSGDPSSFMKEHNNNFNVEGERTGRYWNGLPISEGNYLFVDPFSTPNFNLTKDRFFNEISGLSIENFANADIVNPIYDRFYPLIGINGIMDVFVDRNDELNVTSPVIHNMGEYIYSLIEPNDDVEYGLEVTTRGILQNAPLHGFIWETISHRFDQYSDPADIFRFVDDRLCYFKNYSGMAVVYISCVHGVGHGLDGIFGLSTDKSISICEKNENNDFKYTCATGVYMSAVPNYPRQYPDPCLLRFPATCFRFKRYSPCSQFSSSRYHEIGCVWGQSYLATSKKPFFVSYFCSQLLPSNILSLLNSSSSSSINSNNYNGEGEYGSLEEWERSYEYDRYVACVDGYLSNAAMWSVPENMANATCASLIGRRAQDTCLKSKVHVMDYEIDDGVQWDYPLLEKYFDPDQPPFPLRHPTDDEIAALNHSQAINPTQGEGEHHHG